MLKNKKGKHVQTNKQKINVKQILVIILFLLLLLMLKFGHIKFMDFFTCITTIIGIKKLVK